MAIKVIPINGQFPYPPYESNDCIALRMFGENAQTVEISFPFHEDTPNFKLTISETMDLRNAIDQLLDIKMLEKPRGN